MVGPQKAREANTYRLSEGDERELRINAGRLGHEERGREGMVERPGVEETDGEDVVVM